MNWVDIVVFIVLVLSFLGGLKDGVVKSFSSLVALLISIPLASMSYGLLASLLAFLPGENWQNFLGFFITMGIIGVILNIIFFIPRKIIGAIWSKGVLFRLLGAVLNLIGAIIGMVVFVFVLQAYPIFDWLAEAVSGSGILPALADAFSIVKLLLPEFVRQAAAA